MSAKVHCSHDRMIKVSELKPHPKNRNKHPKDQLERLARILDYQGWRYPVKVSNLSGYVTSGHGRIEAAKVNGWKEVPVNFQDYESEEQEYADVQSDNAIASWAELDLSAINTDVVDLGPDFDIDLLGIKDFEIEPADKFSAQCDEDEVPEKVDTRCKSGDLWKLGDHRLLCGDSTNIQHVERLMGDEKADLVFTDPPYGVAYEGGSKKREKIENDAIPVYEFYCDFLTLAKSVSKAGASIYIWHAPTETHNCIRAAIDSGWLYKQYIIWRKNNATLGRQDYHWQHEPCLYGWGSDGSHAWYGGRKQTTVWDIDRPPKSEEHPTMKPVELCERGILNSSKIGDVVYEPFGGSGSTLVGCEKNNRKCRVIELSPQYCDVIISRWEKYTGKEAELLNGET